MFGYGCGYGCGCGYGSRKSCAGLMVASFGAGLIAAHLIPYSVIAVIAATALIVAGIIICRNC